MPSARVPIVIVLLIVALGAASTYYWESPAREIIPWRKDLPTAIAEAAQSRKPIFIDFTASWCEPCRSMRGTTWASADVKAALDRFVPVQIDVDAAADIAGKFQINAIPHFFICDPDGTPRRDAEGAMNPREMIDWLGK